MDHQNDPQFFMPNFQNQSRLLLSRSDFENFRKLKPLFSQTHSYSTIRTAFPLRSPKADLDRSVSFFLFAAPLILFRLSSAPFRSCTRCQLACHILTYAPLSYFLDSGANLSIAFLKFSSLHTSLSVATTCVQNARKPL